MALTQEQKEQILSDQNFKKLMGGQAETQIQTQSGGVSLVERARQLKEGGVEVIEEVAVEEKPSVAGGVARGVAKGAVSTLTGASGLGEKIVKGLGRFVTPKRFEERLGFAKEEESTAEQVIPEEFRTPEGKAEKIGFGLEQVGEFFIPTGLAGQASKLGKATKFGVTGAEVAGRTAIQTGDVGKEELVAGVTAPIVGGVLSKVGEGLFKALPKRFIQKALGQSKKELKAGKDVSEFALEKKKFGTAKNLVKESESEIKRLSSNIDNKLDALPITTDRITRKSILGKLEKVPAASNAKLDSDDLLKIIRSAVPQSKTFIDGKQLSVKNANELRKVVDKQLGDKFFLSSQQGTESKEILGSLRKILETRVKESSGTDKLFKELSNEITFSKALQETIDSGVGKKGLGLTDLLLFSGAGATTGFIPAAGAVGAKKALESTPFLTSAGVTLNELKRVQPILEKLTPGEQGIISQIIQKLLEAK